MADRIPANFRRVITAAAGGNVIEWYDFYIFGSLATILSVKFFEKSHPVAALLSTIALFTIGFLVRPLGAFVFGWLGDRVGRKYTFILTLVGMALGTGAIGLIPTFDQIGLAAAIILFCLRMIQGLCLGGSYGGAITYVAEHVPEDRRGYYTGWLQTSPTLGIVLSLIVIIVTRTYFGEKVFNDWAWRIPFLCSFLLLFVTMYMRSNFEESPVYEEIKAKGKTSKNPWREAFLNPQNLKYVVIASIVVLGEGVVWYSSQFWALFFLQTVMKVDTLTSAWVIGVGLVIGTPTLIFWGWMSDIIGRKPVILGGFFLAAVTYYPLYTWLGMVSQPGTIAMGNGNFWAAVRRHGIRADRRLPRRILPRPHPLHGGVDAVHDRQRLGRWLGADHHRRGLPGDRQHRLRADLSDRRACGVSDTQPVPDARNSPYERLGRRCEPAWSKSLESKLRIQAMCGARWAPHFFVRLAQDCVNSRTRSRSSSGSPRHLARR
jgi:MFS family permease